jgi:FMN phosphatase YigB (HAD superfamily)
MLPPMAIKVITFDWGDTLAANYGMPYLETQRRAFRRLAADLAALGCTVPEGWSAAILAEIEREFARTISPEHNAENREMDMGAMFSRWLREAGAFDAGDAHAVQVALARCTATLTDTVIPFAEAAPALALLRARGYRLGVLSHVPWPGDACRSWFDRHGLGGFFDFYSLSCEVGWIKPHPSHFRHALDQAGCAAHEILHVGDHPLRDVRGGRAAGFRTVLRHTENIHAQEALASCAPDAEIVRLRELVEIAARF